jgi:membrane protease YdiL (CAAX protease family)
MIPALALVPALVLPTVAALFYFVLAAGHWSAALIYGGTKVAMIFGPLICAWRWGRPATVIRTSSWTRISAEGLLLGLLMGGFILAAALGPLAWLFALAMPQISEKINEFKLSTPAAFISAAVVISLLHSAFEEWYWRWFAVGALHQRMRPAFAHVIGGLAFAGHHIVVVSVYAGPFAGLLLGLVVGVAGLTWSLLHHRHGSLLGAWIAHACCDIAIMYLGWLAIHPVAA